MSLVKGSALIAFCAVVSCAPGVGSAQDPGAVATYRAAVDAFSRGDADQYFAAFAPELLCFYDAGSVPVERVRNERAAAIADNRRRPGTAVCSFGAERAGRKASSR